MGTNVKDKVDYSPAYLEAKRCLELAHDALTNNKFQQAYEHCLNAQVEMRLMGTAVKSWIPRKDD